MPKHEITLADAREIRWLHRCGLNILEITQLTHFARGTVGSVIAGKWQNKAEQERLKTTRRCPGCGNLCHRWPCLACKLRGRRYEMPERVPERIHRTE